MWIGKMTHGSSPFNDQRDYKVYRNVMDFGCKGDGVADDTDCINEAISSGTRCGHHCGSSTLSPALVYFPSGIYRISSPLIMFYFTQLVGNARNRPTLVAAPNFKGIALIDSDPYQNDGSGWYTNQNNFFRQLRNFVIDLTLTPSTATTTGIHWQVAQATCLNNILFKMSTDKGTGHQGIWMENGSGGFMSNLVFVGGRFGMWVGNQQFLSRNLTFTQCTTAIYMNWNWQWSFKNVRIDKCEKGIEMHAPSDKKLTGIGSVLLLDSIISDTPSGIVIGTNEQPQNDTSGTLLLDNIKIVNVTATIVDKNGKIILNGGSTRIVSWGRGSFYTGHSGVGSFHTGNLPAAKKNPNLLDSQGTFFERSRPQYENLSVSDFVNVKNAGAKGDGETDDTAVIQKVISDNVDKVIFFPAGSYIITKTVSVPPGTRLTGETWSVLMAFGSNFGSETKPTPMLQVGHPGQSGVIEISDMMFSIKGPAPGAILVEWNIRQSFPASCGMWDSHFRVGGNQGSKLQVKECPKGQGPVPHCMGAFMLLHLTPTSSAYLENVWAWTADHDLDNPEAEGQISVYTGRGVLIESKGPVWLYGTQSEHSVLYQYQLLGAKNIFMTMIQSETPYFQSGPPAPKPFGVSPKYEDPSYDDCTNQMTCPMAWALRSVNSSNVYIYGAGLYNFFNNYHQSCLAGENCQDSMVQLEQNSQFYLYNLNTKGATNMVVAGHSISAQHKDNPNGFCATVNAFLSGVST